MPCQSSLVSSCSAPFLGAQNVAKDFNDRQVHADHNFMTEDSRRRSTRGLATKHDSITALTPSYDEGQSSVSDQVMVYVGSLNVMYVIMDKYI